MISKYLAIVLSLLSRAISYVPALIYGYIYSEFFTK